MHVVKVGLFEPFIIAVLATAAMPVPEDQLTIAVATDAAVDGATAVVKLGVY